MVDDVRLEDFDALAVGHLLGVALHLDIEGEDDGVPGGKEGQGTVSRGDSEH